MSRLADEIAIKMHNAGLGVYGTSNPDLRTIFTGEMPQDVTEGYFIIEVPSPPPHQYIDTEYPVFDIWYRSPKTDRAHDKLEEAFNLFHRNYHYELGRWYISFSQALGTIVDV